MARGRLPVKSNTTRVSLNDRFTGIKKDPNVNTILKHQKEAVMALIKSQKIISQMEKRPAVRAALQRIKSESQNQQGNPTKKQQGKNKNARKQKVNSRSPAEEVSVKERIRLPVKQRLQVNIKDRISRNTKSTPKQIVKPMHGGFRTAYAGSTGAQSSNFNVKASRGRGNVATFQARKQKNNMGAHLSNTRLQNGANRNFNANRGRGTFQPRNRGTKSNKRKQ